MASVIFPLADGAHGNGPEGRHLEAGRSGRREMWNALRGLRIGRIAQILAPTIPLVIVCNLHPATSLTGPAYGQDGISP